MLNEQTAQHSKMNSSSAAKLQKRQQQIVDTQLIADHQYLSKINASPNVIEFYDTMNNKLKQFGKQIKTEVDSILAYEVTKVGGTDAAVRFIIDMRNDYGDQSGLCLIGENVEKMTSNQR